MRKAFALAGIAVLFTCTARGEDLDAKKIIDKAIEAHGGADALAKNKDKSVTAKSKMTINQMGGIEATMESLIGDKKFRHTMDFSIMGMNFNQIICYDGKEMWIALNGKVMMTISGKDLEPIKDAIYAEELAGLVLLKEKGFEFSVVGESKLDDQELVGIRVSNKDHKDVTLHFDKKTGMLTKIESRNLDFQTSEEVAEERIMKDYKKFEGVLQPTRIVVNRDGKKFVEIEFSDMKYGDKLDDSAFEKPK
jgi:outer membrane lipoprotein-sorting protein